MKPHILVPDGRPPAAVPYEAVEGGSRARAERAPRLISPERLWIAWEKQRRSLNLSQRVGARLRLCIDEDKGLLRYPLSTLRTVRELAALAPRRGRPAGIAFVQNPSMVLAALACLLKPVFRFFLVVDRHSNFSFLSPGRPNLRRRLSDRLSGFTLRRADLTIVTNAELAARIEAQGGRPFILPDPFPLLPGLPAAPAAEAADAEGKPMEVLFVSSWAFDEPIAAAVEACRRLRGKVIVRITGRPKAAYASLLAGAPDNFIPTGFLSDEAYFSLMARCDAVMAVTNRAATLVCGAYESVACGKPMILGDTRTLREYFDRGAVYTDSTAADLEAKLEALRADLPRYRAEVRRLGETRGAEWEARLGALEARLPGPVNRGSGRTRAT